MKLQTRDKMLMEQLYRFGALTTTQIRKLCFKNVAHTTVLRRLRVLEKNNFLLRQSGLEEGLLCWSLTQKGAQSIGLDCPNEYRNKNILRHTTILADVRLSLEKIGLGKNWISEVELKRRMGNSRYKWGNEKIVPDGLFAANIFNQAKMVAVELELNIKSRSRYHDLFQGYAFKGKIGLIWYIVENMSFAQSLIRIWDDTQQFRDSPKLRISLLHDVLENAPLAKMMSSNEVQPVQSVFNLNLLGFAAQEGAQGVSTKTNASLSTQQISDPQTISTV